MAPTTDNNPPPAEDSPTNKEWNDTQSVLAALLRAWKNYSLYPETHVNSKSALKNFHKQIEIYLNTYGTVRFEFIKGHLLFKGKSILSEPREEGNLTYNLFRDGIQWLQFKKGLEEEESKVFLSILNRYRILADEPDGDLVTALWSTTFPHIQYHVTDFFWGVEPEMTFSTTSTSKNMPSSPRQKDPKATREFESIVPLDAASLKMTHKEYEELNQRVLSEEQRDPIPDFLDAMIDCLLQHKRKDNFISILTALEKEFHDSIARKDFDVTLRILKSLHYVLGYSQSGTPWVRQTIEKFFESSQKNSSLQPIEASWEDMSDQQLAKVKDVLLLFQPDAIEILGKRLLQASNFKIQQMLMDVIFALASRNYRPIEALLNRPEEDFVRKLVKVLGQLKGDGPEQMLLKMTHHASPKVRQEAVRCLLNQDPKNIEKLFNLIDDENEIIRRTILNYMGREKNVASEEFLINYLQQEKFKSLQESNVIKCYKTLGQCGSDRAIPFLIETLNGRGGVKDLLKLTSRRGAAIALKVMGTKESMEALEVASRSLYPNIRYIVRPVLKE